MFHSLPREYLYSAYRISSAFADCYGKEHIFDGTCFFINSIDGSHSNLVTNRHVIDPGYKNPKWDPLKLKHKHTDISGYFQPFSLQTHWLKVDWDSWITPPNTAEDVALLSRPEVLALNDHDKPPNPFGLSASMLATSNDFDSSLEICDLLAFPGYPPWFDRNGMRPIIRCGSIASDPSSDYQYDGATPARRMAYEAFSFGGSSGSPVFALAKGIKVSAPLNGGYFRDVKLIGINAGHLSEKLEFDRQHSGISYLFKATTILECLDLARTRLNFEKP